MNHNCLILYFSGITAYFIVSVVAREAIVGGQKATLEAFPYVVSLLEVDQGHICGGAIIAEQHILSAAHCFLNRNNTFRNKRVYALVGTVDLMKMTFPAFNSEVEKVYVPTAFNGADFSTSGDIAVLKLLAPMPILVYRHLKSTKLEVNQKDDHHGKKATVSGWGWNSIRIHGKEINGARTDSDLRFAIVDISSNQQCKNEHPTFKLASDHLCAKVEQHGHEPRGVCYGDDGDPLVHDGYLIGILIKYPRSCSEKRKSAVYTRVSHYLTFMRKARDDHETRNMRVHVLPHSKPS